MANKLYGTNGGWAAARQVFIDSPALVYSSPYHVIVPIVSSDEWSKILEWCVETFGTSKLSETGNTPLPDQRWYPRNGKFLIKHDADRDWFMLRWA